MNEQIEVLKSIYSRPNEFIYNEHDNTIVYNAFDDQRQIMGFSVHISSNRIISLQSQILNRDEFKQFQAQISFSDDLYELFNHLKEFYDELMIKRQTNEIQEIISVILMKIDHMRSMNTYMKHLRQWTNELNITGRVWIIPQGIYLLIEGIKEQLKKFVRRLKNETVDIDSRGRPCKERLVTQLIEYDQQSARFDNFEKIEFNHRKDFLEYLTKSHYENLIDYC